MHSYKYIIANFWEKVFNEGDMTPIDEVIGPNYTYNGAPGTPEGTKAWATELREQFPGLHFTIEDLLGDGDKVAIRWKLAVTDKEGRELENTATNIITFADGQAISNWQTGGEASDFVPVAKPSN